MRSLVLTLALVCSATPAMAMTCEESFQKKGDFFNGSAFSARVQIEGLSIEQAFAQLRPILARDGIRTIGTDLPAGHMRAENPATPFQRALPIDVYALTDNNITSVEMVFTLPGGVGAGKDTVRKHLCHALNQLRPAGTIAASTTTIPASANPASNSGVPRQNVYKIANQTTVLIDGQAPGSGVIFSRVGNTYYVLTAKHVVATPDEYKIIAPDGKSFPLNYSQVKKLGNLDLAILQFNSSENFAIAQLGNSERINQGDSIFVSGWPAVGQAITKPTHQVTDGRITGWQKGDADGYELTYSNSTAPGMSGGPVFNASGQVIGIHGRAAGNAEVGKVGINLGIPIHLFLRQVPKTGLNLQQLGLRIEP